MKALIWISVLSIPVLVHSQISGRVMSVQDGDSFRFQTQDSIYRVRLNGIDCPEVNQIYGDSATIYLDRYTAEAVVIIEKGIDKYGRTIADVFYKDSLINLDLVQEGLAWHYKKYSSDPVLAKAEISARKEPIGLWSANYQIAPWDWRAGNFDRSLIQGDATSKVFMCIGPEETGFHHVHYCSELKNCNSSIILVYPSEAGDVYRKSKCSKCHL